jgi:hypothetical protein
MAKTLSDMFAGMEAYLLAQNPLTAVIDRRLWELGDPAFIAVLESLTQEAASSHGQFVIYRDAGERVGRLLGGKESKLRFAAVEMRSYGRYPSDARALREILLATIGMGHTGTWTGSGGVAVTIKNATWATDGQEMDFDETIKMSFATALLIVPYVND